MSIAGGTLRSWVVATYPPPAVSRQISYLNIKATRGKYLLNIVKMFCRALRARLAYYSKISGYISISLTHKLTTAVAARAAARAVPAEPPPPEPQPSRCPSCRPSRRHSAMVSVLCVRVVARCLLVSCVSICGSRGNSRVRGVDSLCGGSGARYM